MAKRRSGTKTRPKAKPRRKRTKKTDLAVQWLKIFSGLGLLVLLLVGAGLLAHLFIKQPGGKGNEVPPSATASLPPVREPQKPAFEVFPQKEVPPEPLTKLKTLPGDQPPVVAIIIDDIGYDRQIAARFLDLHIPLTLSLLPYGPFSRQIMSDAQGNGHEIMLHLPMEPNEYPQINPGRGALLARMSADELIRQLERDLDRIPGLRGVNNHMGSRLTTSPERMRQIFTILKKRDLFYIDSRTTAETVARSSAELLQVPFAERDIFIDHVDEPAFIRSQLDRLIKRAKTQGYAVGIAHPHDNTYRILKEMLPRLQKEVQLVPASMVVQAQMLAANTANGKTR